MVARGTNSQGPICEANVPTEGKRGQLGQSQRLEKGREVQIRSGTIEGAGGDVGVVVVGL